MPLKDHFERSPLNEVVCGFQFPEVRGWLDVLHFGLLYERLRSSGYEMPPSVKPALVQMGAPPGILLGAEPGPQRVWYEGSGNPFLIQVQSDRFIVNWRRGLNPTPYPHFLGGVYDKFEKEWSRFSAFCEDNKLGAAVPDHAELTYVNHLVDGENGLRMEELPSFLTPLGILKSIQQCEAMNIDLRLKRKDLPIRLTLRSAARKSDGKSLVVLELSIQAPLVGQDHKAWFVRANHCLTELFVEITTDLAKDAWGYSRIERMSHV